MTEEIVCADLKVIQMFDIDGLKDFFKEDALRIKDMFNKTDCSDLKSWFCITVGRLCLSVSADSFIESYKAMRREAIRICEFIISTSHNVILYEVNIPIEMGYGTQTCKIEFKFKRKE